VTLHYSGHVLGCNVGVPDVVGVDEDDRTFLVATGASIAEYGGRRDAVALDLVLEHLE